MVYIQQAMNLALEHRKRGPPHYYPRIHMISIREDSLDNLPDFCPSSNNHYSKVLILLTDLI